MSEEALRAFLHRVRAYPPPPPVIPDWRRFEGGHPKSSQIGVDLTQLGLFGVGFHRVFDHPIPRSPDHPI
jgi:hypothetical protein